MGAFSGLIGTAGGANGSGFGAPQQANVQQGTVASDILKSQNRTEGALGDQQRLLDALRKQNGLGMQTNVANQQQALANQLAAANGIGTQNQAISGLQNAANMYQNIAQGNGPNPAQAMLNQQTGANIANQAALMAGQRGAGANIGLLARQAAQQGGALQQNAVGQGATMQANQQLNALQGVVGAQQAVGGLGTSQLGAQQNQQAAMANQANQIAGQQIAQSNQNAQANLANQQQMQNALAGINNANVSSQASVNTARAGLANTNMQGQQAMIGGALNPAGGAAAAHGGEVMKLAYGGDSDAPGIVATPQQIQPTGAAVTAINSPQSDFGQLIQSGGADASQNASGDSSFNPSQQGYGSAALQKGMSKASGAALKGIKGLMGSGGEGGVDLGGAWAGSDAAAGLGALAGGAGAGAAGAGLAGTVAELAPLALLAAEGGLAESGGHVQAKAPEQKAVKSGDSYANDKIPAKLSEGEIVLPRSVTMSEDPARAAAEFVSKTLAERGHKPKTEGTKMLAGDGDPETAPTEQPSDTNPVPPGQPQAAPMPVAPAVYQAQAPAPQQPMQDAAQVQPQPQNQVPNVMSGAADPAFNELVKVNTDMATGKIHPKSFSDYFGEKSFPGKIGTILGLIISGAGSGLSHQPNAALDIINKQLDRDLQMQKTALSQGPSFYSSAQDLRAKQIANAKAYTEGLVQAGTAGEIIPELKNEAMDSYVQMLEGQGNHNIAKAYQWPATFAKLRETYQGNPDAIKALDTLEPLMHQESYNNYKQGQAAYDAADKIKGSAAQKDAGNQEINRNSIVDKRLLTHAVLRAKANDPRIRQEIVDGANSELPGEMVRQKQEAQYLDTVKKLMTVRNGGQIPIAAPLEALAGLGGAAATGGNALAAGASAILAKAPGESIENYFNRARNILKGPIEQFMGPEADTALPGWNDNEKTKPQLISNGKKFFDKAKKTSNLEALNSEIPGLYKDLNEEKWNSFSNPSPAKKSSKSNSNKKAVPKERGILEKVEDYYNNWAEGTK